MDAGALDTRVVVRRITKTDDGYGGTSQTITNYSTVWAKKEEVSGSVETESGKRKQFVELRLTMRKKTADTINTTDLLKIDGVDGDYRINEKFDSKHKYFTTIRATKIG